MRTSGPVEPAIHAVPPRALAIAVGVLVVATVGALLFRDAVAEYGFLV